MPPDFATIDYANLGTGAVSSSVAGRMLQSNFDPHMLRPFIGADGRQYLTRNRADGGLEAIPVTNADAALLYKEWQLLDEVVIRAALPRLRAVADVRGRGLQFTIPNGMAKSVLLTQTQSSVNAANISMDGLAEGPADRPVYGLNTLPLPIIHKDFQFSARELAVSRNGSMPLDLSTAELAARRVAEGAEQLLLGVAPSYSYGGGTIYGLTNFPGRIIYTTVSDPTASPWTARNFLLNVLAMRQLSQHHFHYGPWVLYTSLPWDQYLDDDLSIYKGDLTLRDRIRRVDGIEDVITLDYLNGYDALLVQMTTDVVREVVGMDITTLQWSTHGGMQLNFKIMCILTPQVRADYNGNTGIVHGSVSGQTSPPPGEILLPVGNP